MMDAEPTGIAAIVVAVITAAVTLWTQRGGARARRRTAALEERAQSLAEFKTFMSWSETELREQREQISSLRGEVRGAQQTARVASDHIRTLRTLVPSPPGPPPLPDILRDHVGGP